MDSKIGKTVNVEAQVVNGTCPTCAEDSVFVSVYKTIFRCVSCGTDLEQKINGKISYMPVVTRNERMHLKPFNE
jgi:uncharacterized protein (DUF983 family)|tara:strand:- start:919 stop:1140 length:222 start_codon:yes stop_codon:yes gene_type:complete